MANQKVTYEIRLKDLMSKTLRGLSKRVRKFAQSVRTGMVNALKMAGRAMKTASIAAVAAGAAIGFAAIRLGKSFLDAASNLEDTQAKFGTVFRGVEDEALGMVKSISEGLKIGEGSVMGFMSTFQDTLVPLGFAREEAARMSAGLTSLALDLEAFNPSVTSTEQAIGALQSVLVGMYRPALQFGVQIKKIDVDAEALALGLVGVNEELSAQAEKVAALSLLLKGTTDAQGAFLRMGDSLTVQTIQFNEAVTDLEEEMGGRLKIALNEAINSIGGIDVVINAVRIGFEFFTNILTQFFIPGLAKVLTKVSKFVEGMGGVDETVIAVRDSVVLAGKMMVTTFGSVTLVLMLFAQGIDTVAAGFKGFFFGVQAVVLLLAKGYIFAIKSAAGMAIRFSEANEKAFTRISAVVRDSLSFVTKGLGGFVRAIGEAMITYSSLVEGDDNFFFDAGNDALAAGRKIAAFGYVLDDISDPEAANAMRLALRQMQIVAVRAGIEVDKMLLGASEKLEGIGAEFVDDISARVPLIKEIMDAVGDSAEGVGVDFDALKGKIESALAQMGTIELTSPEEVDAAAKLTKHLEMLKGIVGELPQGYNNAAAAAQGFNEEAGETTRKISGMNDGVKEFRSRIASMGEDLAGLTENALVAFGNGLTDAFVSMIDGSKSAKEAFADFASQFLIDIGRMIIQLLIFQAIAAAAGVMGFGNTMFGGLANGGTVEGGVGEMTPLANGGVVSGGLGRALPMKGYANGGPIVNKPHVALIGEGKYNEAVVPLPDGRSIPVEMQGGGGANVTVEINAVDARSVDALFRERKDTLTDIIRNAISQSRQFRSAVGGA